MPLPSVTICSYQGNIRDMLLDCDINPNNRSEPCIIDNLNINYLGITYNCIRLNFASDNTTILQKSEDEGRRYGYNIWLYIPNGAYVDFAVNDNKVLAVEGEIINAFSPGDVNDVIIRKSTQENLGKLELVKFILILIDSEKDRKKC